MTLNYKNETLDKRCIIVKKATVVHRGNKSYHLSHVVVTRDVDCDVSTAYC